MSNETGVIEEWRSEFGPCPKCGNASQYLCLIRDKESKLQAWIACDVWCDEERESGKHDSKEAAYKEIKQMWKGAGR